MTLYTITCHCGVTKQVKNRRQKACSYKCRHTTPEGQAALRAAGRASGIARRSRTHAETVEYRAGYRAGWMAGRRAAARLIAQAKKAWYPTTRTDAA
jgi:hypothetical protein